MALAGLCLAADAATDLLPPEPSPHDLNHLLPELCHEQCLVPPEPSPPHRANDLWPCLLPPQPHALPCLCCVMLASGGDLTKLEQEQTCEDMSLCVFKSPHQDKSIHQM